MEESSESQTVVVETKPVTIELQSADLPSEHAEISEDNPDNGRVEYRSKTTLQRQKEIVSLSYSLDDDTEIPGTMTMSKKSHVSYKGMMDIALLTANANQLRFLITYNSREVTYCVCLTLLIMSISLQVIVGLGMIYKRHIKRKGCRSKAEKLNSLIICGMFCLTVINVLIVSFTTTTPPN